MTTELRSYIEKTVNACYDTSANRRISLTKGRDITGRPHTTAGMLDTITEAKAIMEDLKAEGRITWYTIMQINADGPEWIRFTLPPRYARIQTNAALDSVPDAE